MRKVYNKRVDKVTFKAGDQVLYKSDIRSSAKDVINKSLSPVWLGPVTTEAMATNNAALLYDQSKHKKFIYHVSLFKRSINRLHSDR